MKTLLNRHLFTQTDTDSGALTVHGAVIHTFAGPCSYDGIVYRGREIVGRFTLHVEEECSAGQVNIDLTSVDRSAGIRQTADSFSVGSSGHVVFRVSRGRGGYAVVVQGREASPKVHFDSRVLRPGDYFTVNPLRPGTYAVSNSRTKAEARVVIDYPDLTKGRNREPAAPAMIGATPKGFSSKRTRIRPPQGIVFSIETPSRIKLQLIEASERPAGNAKAGKKTPAARNHRQRRG